MTKSENSPPAPQSGSEKQSWSKLSYRQRNKLVIERLRNGDRARDVADFFGISPTRICTIARRYNFDMGWPRVHLRPRHRVFKVIDELALEAKVSRATLTSRLLDVVAPDVATARKNLGKSAKPKRRYRKREEELA